MKIFPQIILLFVIIFNAGCSDQDKEANNQGFESVDEMKKFNTIGFKKIDNYWRSQKPNIGCDSIESPKHAIEEFSGNCNNLAAYRKEQEDNGKATANTEQKKISQSSEANEPTFQNKSWTIECVQMVIKNQTTGDLQEIPGAKQQFDSGKIGFSIRLDGDTGTMSTSNSNKSWNLLNKEIINRDGQNDYLVAFGIAPSDFFQSLFIKFRDGIPFAMVQDAKFEQYVGRCRKAGGDK